MSKVKLELYVSPEVEVIESQSLTVICQSGELDDMVREESTEW